MISCLRGSIWITAVSNTLVVVGQKYVVAGRLVDVGQNLLLRVAHFFTELFVPVGARLQRAAAPNKFAFY
jgi:hypothetical protein